ncbi:hypothetical protein RYB70_27280, partial [Pseudomonas syringae pv. actinidiae]|nr:hypothetical protein [Pseudomonas syringae pv. actinidiae]
MKQTKQRDAPMPFIRADQMDEAARFTFYEKIYFYELERKEKLISRLNLPLAILVYRLKINFSHACVVIAA